MFPPASNANKKWWSNRGGGRFFAALKHCYIYCYGWTSYSIIIIFATRQLAFGSWREDLGKGIGNKQTEKRKICAVVINYINIFFIKENNLLKKQGSQRFKRLAKNEKWLIWLQNQAKNRSCPQFLDANLDTKCLRAMTKNILLS